MESFAQTFVAVLQRRSVRNLQTTISAIVKEKSLKWIAQKMMWSLIVMLLVLLTCVVVFQTFEDYSKKPTVSNLKVIFNKPISLPNGTICLPLYLGELNDNKVPDVSYNRELSALFNDEYATKELILDYRQRWINSFLHVVHSYLIEISKYDYLEGNLLQNTEKDGDLFLAMRTLETNLRKLNVSVDDLRQGFGVETALFYYLYFEECAVDPKISSNCRQMNLGPTKFVGEKQICYQIGFDLIPLHQDNFIRIYFFDHSLPNPRNLGMDRDWIIVDFLARTHVDTTLIGMVDMISTAAFGFFNEVQIEAAALYRALPEENNEVRCSTKESVDECQAICRAQAIQELYDCVSASWPDLRLENAQNLNECTIDEYTSRLNITEAILNVSNCLSRCLPPCERWTYKTTYLSNGKIASGFGFIQLSFHTLNYVIIEELPKWSFVSFLGEIGGIIGLLLGYTSYNIVHFLFSTFIKLSTFPFSNASVTDRRASNNRVRSLDKGEESSTEKRRQSVYRNSSSVTQIHTADSKLSVNRISENRHALKDETISVNGRTSKEDKLSTTEQASSVHKRTFRMVANKIIAQQHEKKKKMWHIVNNVSNKLKIDRDKSTTTRSTIRWIASTIFKWTVLVIFSYLTIVMGISLIHSYEQKKTLSAMKLYFNKSLALPISTACIDFLPSELDEYQGANASKLNGTEYQDQIKSYFKQKNVTKEKFLKEMNATTPLLYIVAEYLTILTTAEAGIHTDMIMRSSKDSTLPKFFAKTGKDLYLAQVLLEEQISGLDINTNDLRQAFGRHIVHIFSLKAEHFSVGSNQTNTGTYQRTIPFDQFTSFGNRKICYQIRLDQYPFLDLKQDMIVITGRESNESLPHAMTNIQRHLSIDLSAGNQTGIELGIRQTKQIEFDFETFGHVKVNIDSVYHSLSTISSGCSEKRPMDVCLADCRSEYIRRLCNCTATSWSSSGSQECKLSDYTACLNYSVLRDENCTRPCVEPCERWIFHSYSLYDRSDDGLRIEIQMIGFGYTVFEEQMEWTFERVTGAIGGVLYFYLGMNFLKLTHFAMISFAKLLEAVRWGMNKK